MLVVEHDKGGGARADASGAEADPAQRLEGGLQQRVAALCRATGGRVQQVDAALVGGQSATGSVLDRGGEGSPLALASQIAWVASVQVASSGSTSAWARSAVVPCSRPGRTGGVQIRQPSGAAMTYTSPPCQTCLPDHHRSTRARFIVAMSRKRPTDEGAGPLEAAAKKGIRSVPSGVVTPNGR